MAFTISNPRRNITGNLVNYSGQFTSVSGDNTLTVTHGLYYVVVAEALLQFVGVQIPLISTSAGVTTFTWDDTQGSSGQFLIVGK